MALGLGGFGSALAVAADTLGMGGLLGTNAVPGSSFEIEVEGFGTIVLRGRAVPFADVSFPTEMKLKKTLYPGNPTASIQVLTYDSLPTELKGEWNARFLKDSVSVNGDTGAVGTVAQLCQLFENVVRGGRPVRVQWLNVVRSGYLRKFEPSWMRYTDVKWEMTFEWLSANDQKAESPKGLPKPGFGVNDLMKTLKKIEDVIALGPMLARSLSATLVSGVASIRKHVSKLLQVYAAIDALVNMPAALYGAIKSAIASIRDECLELIRRICGPRPSSRAPQIAATTASPLTRDPLYPTGTRVDPITGAPVTSTGGALTAAQASPSGAQLLLLEAFTRSLSAFLVELAHQAIMLGVELDVQLRPEPTQVIRVREGQTLHSIAAEKYGSADYAVFLMQANRLQSLAVPAGFQLALPSRPYGALPEIEITGTEFVEITGGCQGCVG